VFILKPGSKSKHLKGNLLHFAYDSYDQLINAMNKYSTISANEYYKKGERATFIKLVISPLWHFFHSYILKGGFMDGYQGFFVSISVAKLSQLKYIKLRQLYLDDIPGLTCKNPSPARTGLRIGYDAKRAFFNRSGLGNYSRNLINSIVKAAEENSFLLFTPKVKDRIVLASGTEKVISIIKPEKFYHRAIPSLWRSKLMTSDLKNLRLDIYHGLSHELPLGIKKTGIKTVVTIHDVIFLRYPGYYNPVNVFIYRKKMEYACKAADIIVAISTQTKDDLVHFLDVDPQKIKVIPQGCNPVFQRRVSNEEFQIIKIRHKLPDKYLLYVGTIEERKNLINILKAIQGKQIEIPLVVIGRKTDYFHKTIKPFLAENRMDIIIFPEEVKNEELPALYQNALCLVYPSFFEGFGIPILEAITSGIPVITSKGGCFTETGGPGSIYIDPDSAEEIGDAILKISGDMKLRQDLIEKGSEYAKLFYPEKIARQYMNLYKSLL